MSKIWELHGCKLGSCWVVWSHIGMLNVKPNLKRKTSKHKLCAIAEFAYKTCVFFDDFEIAQCIGHRKRMHCRNAKIALALRLSSEIALPVVSTKH